MNKSQNILEQNLPVLLANVSRRALLLQQQHSSALPALWAVEQCWGQEVSCGTDSVTVGFVSFACAVFEPAELPRALVVPVCSPHMGAQSLVWPQLD